ncbi:MAG: 6-phosphofructokinase 1, partial [Campylobacterota bacterium]|nr:6-phosphofructokinase 1 [Campylobacterota bacterium]
DNLRDTASSFKRAFVVEIMGRDCGYLALVSAVTNGAEVMIIPEVEYNLDSMKKRLQDEIKNGRRYIIAMVSEGAKATTKIRDWLKDEVGMECRVTILGHIQRGGNPTVFDRLMAYEFMTKALDGLFKENRRNSIVVYNNSKIDYVSIDYSNSQKHRVKEELINISKHLCV